MSNAGGKVLLAIAPALCYNPIVRRSGGMADAADSKSVGSDVVRVQVPPSAL